MLRRVRVFAGVPVRRTVAAERHATRLAGAQMDPTRADLHALLALAVSGRLDRSNGIDVFAGTLRHMNLSVTRSYYFALQS